MATRSEIIEKTKKQGGDAVALLSDSEIISLVKKAHPDLIFEDDPGILGTVGGALGTAGKEVGQGIVDFSEAGVTGVDNLLTDITNLTVGKVTGKEYQPMREILVPTGEKYEGGLLRRTTGRGAKFFEETWAGTEAETRGKQTKAEGVYQMGGEALKFATGTFGDVVGTGLSTVAPNKLETKVKDLVNEGLTETQSGKWITQKMTDFQENMKFLEKNDPRAYRNFRSSFGYIEGAFEAVGLKKVSGLYKMGGELKHIPIDKIKELTKQATKKLEEAVVKTGEIIKTSKTKTFDKAKGILGGITQTKKDYGKAISPSGHEFILEKTPGTYDNISDKIFNKKNEDLVGQALMPKLKKSLSLKQKTNIKTDYLKGVYQLYDDMAKGNIKRDIGDMGEATIGVEEGLKHWGKKIGEYTNIKDDIDFSKEFDEFMNVFDPKSKHYDKTAINSEAYEMYIKKKMGHLNEYGKILNVKDLQNELSEMKNYLNSNFERANIFAKSPTGRRFFDFIGKLEEKFNASLDIFSGKSKELRVAKDNYRKYKHMQKDFVDSYVRASAGAGKGLGEVAGSIGGAFEILRNPTLSGMIQGYGMKKAGELIGKARSREGGWQMLIRNLDRKAMREYNLKKETNERMANNMTDIDNRSISPTSGGNIDADMDSKRFIVNEDEILDFVQDIIKQIDESVGNAERLIEIKEGIKDFDFPEKYKNILEEKIDFHIRDVENYKREVDTGKTPFDDDFGTVESIYGSDLTKAFNVLQGVKARTRTTKGGDKMTSIEFQKSPAYKTFSSHAEEYLGDNIDNLSVQEVFEKMEDFGAGAKFQTKDSGLGRVGFGPKKFEDGYDTDIINKENFVGFDVTPKNLKNVDIETLRNNETYMNNISSGFQDVKNGFFNGELSNSQIITELNKIRDAIGDTKYTLETGQNVDDLFNDVRNKIVKINDRLYKEVAKKHKEGKGVKFQVKGGDDLFHATNSKFDKFDDKFTNKHGQLGQGHYFSPDKEFVKKFGKNLKKTSLREGLNIYEVKANSPMSVYSDLKDSFPDIDSFNVRELLEKAGYDGIQYTDWDKGDIINIFRSKNIPEVMKDKFQKAELVGQGEEISQAEGKKIVEKYFKADEVGVEFVDKITTLEGLEALGKYRDKLITFSKNPLESTPEHEVLHAFFDTMTTSERKIKVLDDIKVKEKFDNDLDAEEWLADNFVNFARNREVSGITENVKQYFSDMLRGLKTIFFEGDVVENLYRDLENLTKQRGISKPKAVIIGGATKEEEE